jgi:acetylornithine deacetylase
VRLRVDRALVVAHGEPVHLMSGAADDARQRVFAAYPGQDRRLVGDELQLLTFTAVTDARPVNLYFDVPATCYGPWRGNLHAPGEWVDLASVWQATRGLAATALDRCGVA